MSDWQPIETAPAEELVWTKIHDDEGERNVQRLFREGRLWFVPDQSMYVYYTPTHWLRGELTAPDLDHRPHPHGEPNKPHDRRFGK
jgi:hypothetical protein